MAGLVRGRGDADQPCLWSGVKEKTHTNTRTQKNGRTETGTFQSDESFVFFLKWFHWKRQRSECSIQGPMSHWVSVTAHLRSDDWWGGGRVQLSPAPTLRLWRWRQSRLEDLAMLSVPAAVRLIHRPRWTQPPMFRVTACRPRKWITTGKVGFSHVKDPFNSCTDISPMTMIFPTLFQGAGFQSTFLISWYYVFNVASDNAMQRTWHSLAGKKKSHDIVIWLFLLLLHFFLHILPAWISIGCC